MMAYKHGLPAILARCLSKDRTIVGKPHNIMHAACTMLTPGLALCTLDDGLQDIHELAHAVTKAPQHRETK